MRRRVDDYLEGGNEAVEPTRWCAHIYVRSYCL